MTHSDGFNAGIVLAAGESRRMGRNKMLLELAGETIVHRAARRAVEGGLSPVFVVVGHEAAHAERAVTDLPVTVITNHDYRETRTTSLQTGVRSLPPGTPGAISLLADMVLVDEGLIHRLSRLTTKHGASVAACRYGDVIAPPMFFRRDVFDEVLAWQGEGVGRGIMERHRDTAFMLDVSQAVMSDIDTPQEYEAQVDRLTREPRG